MRQSKLEKKQNKARVKEYADSRKVRQEILQRKSEKVLHGL